ncbi:MAG: hypothetical protein H0T89_15480 [Deltaproteobacteria bacterium]|nr:hypothetical protein [Deltaproteobacteria bacterium]MDQ3300537.1 hypothetical protein [Myxococcota bacterium]
MSDDLDNLLRRAMKTLDDQVPSGYFEGLPNRTLARLEDTGMQTQNSDSGTSQVNPIESGATGVPPEDRDEDSGLHDIRSMASSTKLRMSSRRHSTMPPIDEDILASSSAGWKAVALPEPAKMVSLPELAELPAAREANPKDKDKAAKADRASAKRVAKETKQPVAEAKPAVVAAPAVAVAAVSEPVVDRVAPPIIGARFAQQQKKSKAGLFVVVGLGLAAAAGGVFYMMEMKKSDEAAPVVAAADQAPPPAKQKITATPVTATTGSSAAAEPETPAAAPTDTLAIATDTGTDEPEGRAATKAGARAEKKKADKKDSGDVQDAPKKPDVVEPQVKKPTTKEDGSEPSFEELLKEANIKDQKAAKPKLDKKSLSGADIKNGMATVAAKAQACFNGTQGTAKVKLTVAPSGQVEKVSVTGVFAGTPVATCVASAVKGASFPAWDGGPQSFGYSYLLAE